MLLHQAIFGRIELYEEKETGRKSAIKICDLTQMQQAQAKVLENPRNEIALLQKLPSHANIIKLLKYEESSTDLRLHFEYASYGDLKDYMLNIYPKPISQRSTYRIMSQLLQALIFLREQGFSHLDVTPENVLIKDEKFNIVLADFGCACAYEADRQFTRDLIPGKSSYRAPEFYQDTRIDTEKVDVFSFAIIFAELLVGAHLFGAATTLDPAYKVMLEKSPSGFLNLVLQMQNRPRLNRDIMQFFDDCLNKDPKQRPTFEKIATSYKYFCYKQK